MNTGDHSSHSMSPSSMILQILFKAITKLNFINITNANANKTISLVVIITFFVVVISTHQYLSS